jgi:hypothetical protein
VSGRALVARFSSRVGGFRGPCWLLLVVGTDGWSAGCQCVQAAGPGDQVASQRPVPGQAQPQAAARRGRAFLTVHHRGLAVVRQHRPHVHQRANQPPVADYLGLPRSRGSNDLKVSSLAARSAPRYASAGSLPSCAAICLARRRCGMPVGPGLALTSQGVH